MTGEIQKDDPILAGMKEIKSAYIPEGSHIYENDGYMMFYSDGNDKAFIYKKRDWLNEPFDIKPQLWDEDIHRTRLLSRYGL